MDYCLPCRRHLNGALACPGCGAPAEPPRAHAPETYEPQPYEPQSQPHVETADGADVEADSGADASQGRAARRREQGRGGRTARSAGRGPVGDGEASRRDRKAAVHRRRRRRTLLITAGFALAAGALSLAELGIDAPGSGRSNPAAAGGETPIAEDSATPDVTADPLDAASGTAPATASPTPSASASASASASPSPSESEPTATPTDEDSDAPSAPGASSAPARDSRTAPTAKPTPTATPTTSKPAPDPSPSETCNRFLWWCT
ncbi:hypothetical protein [Streptomyces sp. NPDC002328]|uniref:SCO2400 family protein n=1 Tax=Streptomyces sp. NPDC002328 TaxID=3364642 RepID=UPI00369789C0